MLTTAAARCPWLGARFSAAELLACAALAALPDPSRREELLLGPGQPAAAHAAWRLPPRRLSQAARRLALRLDARVEQLRALHEAAAAAAAAAVAGCGGDGSAGVDGGGAGLQVAKASLAGPKAYFNGWEGFVEVQARGRRVGPTTGRPAAPGDNSSGGGDGGAGVEVEFGLFVRLELPQALRALLASSDAAAAAADDDNSPSIGAKRGRAAPPGEGADAAPGGSAPAAAARPAALCCAERVELLAFAPASAEQVADPGPSRGAGGRGRDGRTGEARGGDDGAAGAVLRHNLGAACFSEDKGWGLPRFFGVPAARFWDERPWRELGLIGPEGRLAVGAVVTGLR
jgi:hypothetical protein